MVTYSHFTPSHQKWAFVVGSETWWTHGLLCGGVDFDDVDAAAGFCDFLAKEGANLLRFWRRGSSVRFRVRYWDPELPPTHVVRYNRDMLPWGAYGYLAAHPNRQTVVTTVACHCIDEIISDTPLIMRLPPPPTVEWRPATEAYGDRSGGFVDLRKYKSLRMVCNNITRFDLNEADIERLLECGFRYLPTWLSGCRIDNIDTHALLADRPPVPVVVSSLEQLAAKAIRRVPGWKCKYAVHLAPLQVQRVLDNY